MAEFGVPGFFGKLPSRGDFVSRRLPSEFINAWDGWLQAALAASREQLGAQWLDVYLTSPVWRFVLSPGICGAAGYAGVLIPSVDKVGRYFPLVAAMPFTGVDSSLSVPRRLGAWYARVQQLVLATLDEPALELEAFDAQLASLSVAPAVDALDWEPPGPAAGDELLGWQIDAAESLGYDALNAAVLSSLLTRDLGAYGVWWTAGSERVGASALIVSGLPAASAFTAMLDGDFAERAWSRGVLRTAVTAQVPLRLQSAAVTHPGKVRPMNEDSHALRDDLGVWLVADGLGGHEAGDVASRMVASIVERSAAPTLEATVERLVQNAHVVNGCLQVLAECSAAIALAASTVAVLVVHGTQAAVVWAGDSRIYRLRDGQLLQLTHDHAYTEPMDESLLAAESQSRAITRAVGGSVELDLAVAYDDVRPQDRYLLCTDGLYTVVAEDDLARALSLDDPRRACAELETLALGTAAADNITGVVVWVGEAEPASPNGAAHGG